MLACLVVQEGTAFFPGSSLAGNGLLVSDGTIWQRQRQLSNPAFRQRAVETYAKVAMLLTLANVLLRGIWQIKNSLLLPKADMKCKQSSILLLTRALS